MARDPSMSREAVHEEATRLVSAICGVVDPNALGMFFDLHQRCVLAQAYRYLSGRDPKARATRAELSLLLWERHAYLHADVGAELARCARILRAAHGARVAAGPGLRTLARRHPYGVVDALGYDVDAVASAAESVLERGYDSGAADALTALLDIPGHGLRLAVRS